MRADKRSVVADSSTPFARRHLEIYLERIRAIRAAGQHTPELSYRGALENLLNALGHQLDPHVMVSPEVSDTGAGRPDFAWLEVQSDAVRGVVEVKSPGETLPQILSGEQVVRYVQWYGTVLITNYWDFILVAAAEQGKPAIVGHCRLAPDEGAFYDAPVRALVEEHGEALTDFLLAAMRRGAPVRRPRDLAADLARHAREACRRLEQRPIEDLAPLREAMERTLGLHFSGSDGEHFFRSSLVQTLFYGLFSGWMLWRQQPHGVGTFDWKDASEYLALPLIGNLYEEIARPRRLADLDLREPIEWAAASLNHVDESEFFKSFDADHAITLFYEPFLQAFDPELRKELGVWYTPHEIVQYMVGRVDQLLRSELGIANGLADENVYVLDPAAGTGSYLIEVARRIHKTLTEQGHGALAAAGVRKALTTRIFGFEILPAPYVVAHLQLGVTLRDMGTRLSPDERAGVYLTNALTGWEPPKGAKQTIAFHFLEEEQEAAAKVKREAPILVILGNPPYNGFAGVAQDEEADLIEPYKRDLAQVWGVRRQLLDDRYVRFFRLAERKIGEQSPCGIVSYISNYSWLDGLSHPIMREHVVGHFDEVWIDNCNGDKYKTGKRTPDGKPDQSMFTTDSQPAGIQVGTAITTLVRRKSAEGQTRSAEIFYRDLWGFSNDKRAELLRTLALDNPTVKYSRIKTSARQRWVLKDAATTVSWDAWATLPEMLPVVFKGVQPGRGGSLVSIDREPLVRQMRTYFDPGFSHSQVREAFPELMADEARYDADLIRQTLLARERRFDPQNVVQIDWLPFDIRWTYWEPEGKLLNEKRREFREQVFPGNLFLACTQKPRKGEFPPPVVTTHLGSYYVFDPYTTYFPMVTRATDLHGDRVEPNINPALLDDLCEANSVPRYAADGHRVSAEALRLSEGVFYHVLAVLWSPAYRKENEAALRQDWPRVPVPTDAALLAASAALGREVADLLLPDRQVNGVTVGQLRPELRDLAVPSKVGGGSIDDPADTWVDAGWGFRGQKNAVMCGRGRVVPHAGLDNALDVYINDSVYWSNVPAEVFSMTVGGYPVVKKWLSYREQKVLGRALRTEELTYVTQMVRRLKALLLLGPKLDANYSVNAAATLPGRQTIPSHP